jgi:hypothetical protein
MPLARQQWGVPSFMCCLTLQTAFQPDTAYSGIYNSGFIFLLGLLGSQWAMVGYDTAAHMVEETVGAEISGERRGACACAAAPCACMLPRGYLITTGSLRLDLQACLACCTQSGRL